MAARNFSLRPSEFYGLDDNPLILADFDLCHNYRLVLFDLEMEKQRTESLIAGMATSVITDALEGALGREGSGAGGVSKDYSQAEIW